MKVKIYQPFFKDEDVLGLDPSCVHIDLRNQTAEEALLREHTINMKCRELALADGLDVWGMVSWKYRSKVKELTGIDFAVSDIIKTIVDNPGFDAYFFDVYPRIMNVAWNVWEHGQWYHPHMLEICEELFPAIGLDINLLYMPMGANISCYANYYMGNQKFWDGWLDLIERYQAAIPKLSPRIRDLHNGPSNYGPFPNLWYFPFIHERLYSTFLLQNVKEFKICGTHLGSYHDCAIILSRIYDADGNVDFDMANDFLQGRKTGLEGIAVQDLATEWINKLKGN